MGMFDFLKKIFGKEEEIQEEKIKAGELEKWFSDKSKQIADKLDNEVRIIKDKVNEEIEKTKHNLETLKNAALRNPNIPFRAKQMMDGNREAYIKRVSIFLKQIDLEKEYNGLLEFCNNFDDMLTDFGKSTIKTYHILQEFLAHESSAIAGNIRNLGNFVKELKNRVKESDIDSIKTIKEDIILLDKRIKQRERAKNELEEKTKEKEELIKSIKEIDDGIEILKKDKEYDKLVKLKSEKNKIAMQIDEHKSKLFHSFSIIEMALKKFSRMAFENEKIINKYIENPLFLIGDDELKIISILKNLEKNIINNQIQLKDKKKEKTLEEIRKMNREFFDNFLQKYKGLMEELRNIDKEIGKIDIQHKINELNNKKNEDELRLEGINKYMENLKKNIEEEQTSKLKEEIKKEINHLLKTNIIIY